MTGITDALPEITAGHRPATSTGRQGVVGKDNIGSHLSSRHTFGAIGGPCRTTLDHLDITGVTMRIVTIPAELTAVIAECRMCRHLVLLVDLGQPTAVDGVKASLTRVIGRGSIAVVTNQTGVVPAIAEDIVPFQAERIAIIDFVSGCDIMTPATGIAAIGTAEQCGAAMTATGPLTAADLRCDGVVSKVITVADAAVATATCVACMAAAAMTGNTSTRRRLICRGTNLGAAGDVVTVCTGCVCPRGTAHQGVIVTLGTVGAAGGDDTAVVRFRGNADVS